MKAIRGSFLAAPQGRWIVAPILQRAHQIVIYPEISVSGPMGFGGLPRLFCATEFPGWSISVLRKSDSCITKTHALYSKQRLPARHLLLCQSPRHGVHVSGWVFARVASPPRVPDLGPGETMRTLAVAFMHCECVGRSRGTKGHFDKSLEAMHLKITCFRSPYTHGAPVASTVSGQRFGGLSVASFRSCVFPHDVFVAA